ncbi:MAG TPA: fused MFS/spermidine synthase, partial [Candidatus Acidoferrum sp.]|nr:fused MFS/spermidine synthase [Candidatus Acidoferrum sp.]
LPLCGCSRKTARVKKHTTPPELSPALRRYFYFTAAITGAAIMIVEILGAKMLSPFIGTSHFVWTAQIAVTLIALAVGYYAGGLLVDQSPRPSRLYWAIFFAAMYLSLTIVVCEPVAYWCLNLKPFALGSLVASMFLFFVPLALLAMVGPFFVRVLTSVLANVGGNVGRLTAISTLGSFAGTVLIGYVLVPFLPNSWTMYITALVLMLICIIYFGVWGRSRGVVGQVVTALVMGVSVGALGVYASGIRHRAGHGKAYEEKFYGNSNFGMLQVLDIGGVRYYLNDYLTQNTYDPAQKKSMALFTYMLHGLARVYTTKIEDVLCIGLGIGIVPMQFARDGARVDVVEINPAVLPLAQQFFDFEPSKINLTIGDGRPFLNRCTKQYDAVALDAFLGESSPSHLMSREAFTEMRRVLKPGGVLTINAFASFDPGADFFGASLYRTLTNVFPHVRVHSAGGGNTFFVASDQPLTKFAREPDLTAVHRAKANEVQMAYAGLIEPEDASGSTLLSTLNPNNGRVLTDDFNPVEFFDVKNRERIRRSLAMSMKETQQH